MTTTDVEITADLVRDLLREQHPDLAHLPVRLGARGWDNQLWRLGDDLAVRLPWATGSADALLRKEHAWLPRLAPALPLPVPVPQRLGEPGALFGRPWIVTTWVPGEPADRAPVTRPESADVLAAFLSALHRPAPDGAPTGRGRGGPLADHTSGVEHGLGEVVERGLLADPEPVRAVWQDAVDAPAWDGPAVWLHSDLHPANVVTADGALSGVIDFGDLCADDPAYDLAGAWRLLPDGAVDRFLAAYRGPDGRPADDATRRRARGWAAATALGGLLVGDAGDHGRPGGKPTWGPPARATLERLVATAA